MTILTVGSGQQYSTIASAVDASNTGDTIMVSAGTYTNDFVHIRHDLTLQAVGGRVSLVATVAPPDGKAIVTEGGAGISVSISGFDFSGAQVPDGNGAGIRYEGGNLSLDNTYFHDNQDGLLGAADPAGTIKITNSEFSHNGTGDGRTHNLYVGDIASLTIDNSYFHDAVVGHEIKSRAEQNTITNSRIFDNSTGTASYSIDLPNGGKAVISGNTIQQGPLTQNPNIIAFGEEGGVYAGSSLQVIGNTILNDLGRGSAVWNAAGAPAVFQNNSVFGFGGTALVSGTGTVSATTVLATEPVLNLLSPLTAILGSVPVVVPPVVVPPVVVPPVVVPPVVVPPVDVPPVVVAPPVTVPVVTPPAGSIDPTPPVVVPPVVVPPVVVPPVVVPPVDVPPVVVPPVTVPVVIPPVTPVAGSDVFILHMSEDEYAGNAQFVVKVDGVQRGGPYVVTASHSAGATQAFDLTSLGVGGGLHDIGITFINDAYGGGAGKDRNLFVDDVQFGTIVQPGGVLYSNGTLDFTVGTPAAATASVPLVLQMSEDAYEGDASFLLSVDGVQRSIAQIVTAAHGSGASQTFDFTSLGIGAGKHDIGVTFTNDAYGGAAGKDRNLFVDSVGFGTNTQSGGVLYSNGTLHFQVG